MSTAEPSLRDYVTLNEGAKIAGMKYHTFRAAIDRGHISASDQYRMGWFRLVKRSAVEKFRDNNRK